MPRKVGRPALGGRLVTLRISDDAVGRAEILAAAVPSLTTATRVLARAVELGIAEVERELAGASSGPKNGTGRRPVLVGEGA
jgi:hypothetical protein